MLGNSSSEASSSDTSLVTTVQSAPFSRWVASASLIATISPETGEKSSETALTDSIVPNTSPFSTVKSMPLTASRLS